MEWRMSLAIKSCVVVFASQERERESRRVKCPFASSYQIEVVFAMKRVIVDFVGKGSQIRCLSLQAMLVLSHFVKMVDKTNVSRTEKQTGVSLSAKRWRAGALVSSRLTLLHYLSWSTFPNSSLWSSLIAIFHLLRPCSCTQYYSRSRDNN